MRLVSVHIQMYNYSHNETMNLRGAAQEEAETLVHNAFIAAAERQIHMADAINFKIITVALRCD